MSDWGTWRAQAIPFTSGGLSVAGYDVATSSNSPTMAITYLHGYPSSSHDVEPVMLALGEHHRFVAVDFPGFGASAKPSDHVYSIHAAADAVEAWWRERDVDVSYVISHDYGVSVGQELLARHQEGALDVDLIGTLWMNGGLYPHLHRPTVGQQMLLDPATGAELAAAVTEEMFVDGLRVTWGQRVEMRDDVAHDIWQSMDDGNGVPLMHALLHYVGDRRKHESRWRHALEITSVDKTFVWGDLDPVSGAHMIEHVEQHVPGADVIRLSDVGHWPSLEAPQDVGRALLLSLSR